MIHKQQRESSFDITTVTDELIGIYSISQSEQFLQFQGKVMDSSRLVSKQSKYSQLTKLG